MLLDSGYAKFQSTPSARRETKGLQYLQDPFSISIHSLREEGDRLAAFADVADVCISIHSLREEGDRAFQSLESGEDLFQSTPSARRETWEHLSIWSDDMISIHSLREEGDKYDREHIGVIYISIHSLREEGDCGRTLSVLT